MKIFTRFILFFVLPIMIVIIMLGFMHGTDNNDEHQLYLMTFLDSPIAEYKHTRGDGYPGYSSYPILSTYMAELLQIGTHPKFDATKFSVLGYNVRSSAEICGSEKCIRWTQWFNAAETSYAVEPPSAERTEEEKFHIEPIPQAQWKPAVARVPLPRPRPHI
jgi:hypothetical protein